MSELMAKPLYFQAQPKDYLDSLPPPDTWYEELVRSREMVITGPSKFLPRYSNSLIIGFGATFFF